MHQMASGSVRLNQSSQLMDQTGESTRTSYAPKRLLRPLDTLNSTSNCMRMS